MCKKISIVLPVYNGAKYVGQSIQSVLDQSYTNWELIIVDDCSTDNTLEVVRGFASLDDRIKIISNDTNQQLPKTLNVGFAQAMGEYLTWTSDDNTYHTSALKKMADILDRNMDIDLVYTDFYIVDMDGNLIKKIEEPEPEAIKFADNIGACFLYRKSLERRVGKYNPDMILAEDYDFFIRCYKIGKFYHLKEFLYNYGRHENNLSATRQGEIAHQAFRVMKTHFEFLLSECHTQDERNLFFYRLLDLLIDPHERNCYRKEFYKLDINFAKADYCRRIETFLKRIPHKIYRKCKSFIQ